MRNHLILNQIPHFDLLRMMSFHILGEGTGVTGITMQPPGISSTRVSTAPVQHPPRYGMPAAPQQESPRYGISLAPRNEQPRSSMSEAMAVLQASGNAGVAGRCLVCKLGPNASLRHLHLMGTQKSNQKSVV